MVFLATQIRFSSLCQVQKRFLLSTLSQSRCCLESSEPVRFPCGSWCTQTWLQDFHSLLNSFVGTDLVCGAAYKSWYKELQSMMSLHGKSHSDSVEFLFTGLLFVLSTAILLLDWICSGSNSPLLTIQYLDDWLTGGCLHPRVHLTLQCLENLPESPLAFW